MKNLKILERSALAVRDADNYYKWIYRELEEYIGNNILEIGGGIGNFSKLLSNRNKLVVIDVLQEATDVLRDLFKGKTNIEILQADICNRKIISLLKQQQFDTIICLNVLEHIENDFEALSIMHELLTQTQGYLLLLIPAYQFLYGTSDVLVGHYRRYSKELVRQKLENAGFCTEDMFYFNSLGAIGWFVNYRLFRFKTIVSRAGNLQLKIFDKFFVPILSIIEQIIKPPFGISIIAVCNTSVKENLLTK
jgi:phospholipid N-methyltransferase